MTPEEMEKLPKPLERTMTALELAIMTEIINRIKAAAQITPVVDWLMTRLDAVKAGRARMKRIIGEAIAKAGLDVDAIYEQAARSNHTRMKEIYEQSGRDYTPYEEDPWMQQTVEAVREQTKGSLREMENITQTTGFRIPSGGGKDFVPLSQYLEQSLDKAMLAIATGMKTYNQAIGDVIDEMTDSGVRVVDYASGKSDRIEVAARRAVMTGVAQLTDKVNEKNARELGTDHWEVDWHMGARNTGTGYRNHQSWQGKVYSSEEMRTVCGLGEMLGFAGINCYHIRFPFIPGISERRYTDEWLEEQNRKENQKKPFLGREYDTYGALQYQRRLERTMRKQMQDVTLLTEAGADQAEITAAKSRLRLTEKTYVEFSKEMGLREQRDRLRVGTIKSNTDKAFSSITARHGEYNDQAKFEIDIKGVSREIADKVSDACRQVIKMGAEDGNEHGFTVNIRSGEVRYYTSGTAGEVFGGDFFRYVESQPVGSVISIHNHADNRGFSYTDINTFVTEKSLFGNVAACHNGKAFYVENNIRDFETGSAFTDAELFDDIISTLRADMRSGKIETYQFAALKEERCCERMAQLYFERYEVIEQ